jgi:FAD/FMN-containing dehydrogenase
MTSTSPATTTLSIPDLRPTLTGRVIAPGDADYDQARATFIGGIDRHPVAVIRAANVADVQRVIAVAQATGLELAIRSGGHSGAAHSMVEGGLVLDLGDLRSLDIDVDARTAWAGPGLTAGEYTKAAAVHGLATGFGDTGSVGLGGLILGGGVGYLARQYGLTIDNLLAAEVVTADGALHHVDAHNEPDLFWAIRGGGGNFGVVTRFHLQLHPLEQVYGGMLILPATADTIQGFVAAAEAAPEALTTIANVMPAPPMPFLPAEQHGRLVIMALMVYAGPAEAGEAAVAPLRALAAPLADFVKAMPYPEIYPPDDPNYHPVAASRNFFIDSLDRRAAEAIVTQLQASTAMMAVTQIRVLGGAVARVPAEATAYAHRQRRLMVNVAALYSDPAEAATHAAWVSSLVAALSEGQQPGAYVNFVNDEGPDRVHDAYPPATWERLAAIKQRYDPGNLFHHNQNIAPAAAP